MKKTILLSVAAILLSFAGIAQELNATAKVIKANYPELYSNIRAFGVQKWQNDHNMVVHTINKQAEGYMEAIGLYLDNTDSSVLFYEAILKWSTTGSEDYNYNQLKNTDTFDNLRVDWNMVAYTFAKQIKAKNAY